MKWVALAEKAYAELNAEGVLPRASAIGAGWNAGKEILVAAGANASGHYP